MLFVVLAYFRQGMEKAETDLRARFSDHLASNTPRIRLGGPLKDASGLQKAVFYIAEAPSLEVVQAFTRASPYFKAGLYERVEVLAWSPEVGSLN